MNDTTRILIVEDNLPDFELAQREISRSLKHCEFKRVQTRREYLKALDSFQPDVILSDYTLPSFNGMKALQLAHEHAPLTPLIIWTGTASEDIAVDCMKAGANNYVLKENLKRLGPAIMHALEEQQLLIERRQAEEKNRSILENSPIGIFQSTPQGQFISVNPAMARIYGYSSPEEMIESVSDIARQLYIDPEQRREYTKLFEARDVVEGYELKNVRRDGSIFWTSTSARAVRGEAGNILYYEGFLQDITERKNAEEALRESQATYQNLVETSHDLIWSIDLEGRFTFVNGAARQVYGFEPEELIGRPYFEILDPQYNQPLSYDEFQSWVAEVTEIREVETHVKHRDGRQFILSANSRVLRDAQGKITGITGSSRNITERKQAEARVNDLLEFNEKIINHSPLGILTYKLTGECVFANENAATIVGGGVEELRAQNFHTIQSWRDSGLYDLVTEAIATRSTVTADIHHKSTFGKEVWLRVHSVLFKSKEEDHVLLSLSDITERKQAEDKLHESENRLVLALSAAQMSVWEWNLQTNDVLWSPEFYAITGITETAYDGTFEGYTDFIHPQDTPRVREAAEKAVANNELFAEEFRIIRPDGEVRWLSNLGHAEYGRTGSHMRMIGTVQDITPRKQVEVERQALLEIMQGFAKTEDLHEFLELIHRSIGNVIYAENFFVVFHNEDIGLFEEIYSVDQYDPPAQPSNLEKSITSYVFRTGEPLLLDQARFDELVAQGEVELVGTNSASWLGVPLKTSTGTIGVIVVQDYENPNRYSERDRNFLASIATQVALAIDRKQAERELQQKNDDLGLLNTINDAVIRGQNLDSIVELLANELSRLFSSQGSTINSTIYMLSSDKQSITMQRYFFSPEIAHNIEKLIGFAIPTIQIPVKEGGYFHKAMTSRQSAITSDPQEIQDWVGEFVETKFLPTLAKPVIRKLIPQIYRLLNIKSAINVPLVSEDEVIGFLDVSGPGLFTASDLKRIENIGGQLTAVIQRQKANEKVRRSEAFLQSIQNALSASIAILNEGGTIVQVNSAWREFGERNGLVHPQHCVGLNYLEICDSAAGMHAEEATQVAQAIRAVLAGQKSEARIEYPCHGPEANQWFTLHITKFEDGDHSWVVLAHENITEQKLAEITLAQSQARYQDLFDSSPISLWEEDYSLVKSRIDTLRKSGVTDVAKYLSDHPEEVGELASMVRVTDVNKASVELYRAKQKSELLKELTTIWVGVEFNQFREEVVGLMSPSRKFSWEGSDRTFDDESLSVIVNGSIPRGYEDDWSKVIVSVIDITERKRAEEAEHEQRSLAEALRDTAEILTSTLDYGEVLDHILSAVGRVAPHDAATIMLIDGEYAHVVRSQGYEDRRLIDGILGIKLPVAETANLRQITETGQTVIIHDTHSYPGWHRMQITDWLRSNVGAPILIHGKVIGFILLDSKTVGFFTPVHAERLEAFANQAALAINNANILQQAQEEIAERKRAEEKLRASEERFRQMADNIEEVFWMTNAQTGEELYMSPASEKVWGQTAAYLMQNPNGFMSSILPEDRPLVLRGLEREKAGEKVEMEYRITRPDGSVRWIWDRAFPVFDENGRVKSLAGIAADVTERKLAEEEISRRAEETSALLATSMALTNLDLNAILNSVGNSAKTLFMADGCRIFLMQPDGESLRCVLALQEDAIAFSDLRVRLGEGVTGAVAASGQAEIVNTMQIDPRAVQVPGTQDEEEAIMFAPLKERDRTIGVLSVRRAGTGRPFQPEDLEFLEAFASMAATAVSNARLFEETQRRLAELEALYENGLAVGQLLEPRHIGERIIETFARHLSWHHVAIRLLRQGTDELELIAFNQPDLSEEERSQAVRHFNSKINKIGQGLSGWVVQIGQPIRSGNVYDYPQYIPTYPGILSGLYMPLKIGERVIGVISVESEEAEALTAQDERLLATLANQAAIAFENARLYQAAQQEISERKRVEKELRESQERYQLLVETSPDGVILLGMDGTIRFSNGQMAGLFHVDHPAELVGTSITSLFSPEERQHIEQSMGNPIFSDTPQEGHWLIRKDGSRFFGELRSSALKNEAGEQYAIIAQLRDVTERKQSQEALQEERQRFLDLFENSPNPTWLEDFTAVVAWMNELRTHGVQDLQKYIESNPGEYREAVGLIRILNVNQAAVITNGARNKKELIDRVHELMLDEAPSDVMIHELDMIWQGHTSFGFEMTSRRLNGSLITGIQRIYIPINNDQPDYARVIVTSTDITDRVEMESKLRASELHYRELADSITDVLFELDHDLRYTHWNKASEIVMGIPAYDAIGRSMYEVFGESEEQLRIGRIYQNVLEDNKPRTFETEILLQGQKLVFEINANPSTRGVSVVARNITDRKLTETLLQKRFELMDYALRHSLSEVMQKTIDMASELTGSHIGFMNFIENEKLTINLQAFSTETISQHHNPEARGMHNPVEMAGVWADAIRQRQTIIHNDYKTLENKNGLPGGHLNLIREMLIPIIRNDVVVAVMGVGNKAQEYTRQDVETAERFADYAWDITERKQMENALAEERNQLAKRVEERTADLSRANSNLARALRVKDEFLANMSHELRTPLNAILGLSESLGEQVAGPLNEKQQKYLSTINESGHHLLSLINDILDLAKIEAGQITLDINKVDVNSVCQASLRMIKQLAQKKNQEVVFEMDNDLGLMWADERRLKQMIVNLLSNAVKFTPESGRIGLEVRGDRAANKVIIIVSDTGIGIKEQDLERLFKPFVQLDSGLAREATGTGLGLALVAQMARLHGGSVHALSQPGDGSRFIIQLPWEPAMASDIVARLRSTGKFRAINPNADRLTILLIEDTREVVMMLVDYLEMAGYNILTAQDGIEGLEQAKLTKPDLILMDIQMPRMDGFETTQKLRSDPEFKDIPIIALTALAMPNDRQRCLDAGMDEYMSKPVNLKALTKTIHKLLFQNQKAGLS